MVGVAGITGATDYYPFEMAMPGRNLQDANGYRYAYQGQEKDPETGKEAFELRLWDSRIGRWLTTDPKHEFVSPYLGMGNNPINLIDPDGGSTTGPPDVYLLNEDGTIELFLETDDNFDILIGKNGAMELRKGILDNLLEWSFGSKGNIQNGITFTLYDNWDNPKDFFEFVSQNTYVEWGQATTNSGVNYIGTNNRWSSTQANNYIVNQGYVLSGFNDWRELNHSHPDGNWGPAHDYGLEFGNFYPSGFNEDFSVGSYTGDRANADILNKLKYVRSNTSFHVYDVENKNYIRYDANKVHGTFHFNKKL